MLRAGRPEGNVLSQQGRSEPSESKSLKTAPAVRVCGLSKVSMSIRIAIGDDFSHGDLLSALLGNVEKSSCIIDDHETNTYCSRNLCGPGHSLTGNTQVQEVIVQKILEQRRVFFVLQIGED